MVNGLVKLGKLIYAHRAGIAVTVGVTTGIACVIETARKTYKETPWIIDEHENNMEDLKIKYTRFDKETNKEILKEELTEEEVKQYKKEKMAVYKNTGVKLAKNYALAAGLGAVSITSTLYSYKVIKGQYMAISAAYTVLSDKFDKYRDNIKETFGEVADFNAMNNIKEDVIEEKNEKGKVVKKHSSQKGTDLTVTIDETWQCMSISNAGLNAATIDRQLSEAQRMIEHGAKNGITIASMLDMLGCPIEYDKLPLEYKVNGYATGEVIKYELDYDANMSHWDALPYSNGTKLKAPPITVRFVNAKPVLCQIDNSLGNECLENAYKDYVEELEYQASLAVREAEYGKGVIEEAV